MVRRVREQWVIKNAWVDTDWKGEITKDKQWWVLPREWVWLLLNTFFVKKQAHQITYSSGGRNTQADYVRVRKRRIKEVVDAKVVVGECVARQHRMVVSAMIAWIEWRRAPKAAKKIKWWKLKDPNVKSKFKTVVIESGVLGRQQDW